MGFWDVVADVATGGAYSAVSSVASGDVTGAISGLLTGGTSSALADSGILPEKVANSFGTLGLSDVFGTGSAPSLGNLGKSAFNYSDQVMGTGNLNAGIGSALDYIIPAIMSYGMSTAGEGAALGADAGSVGMGVGGPASSVGVGAGLGSELGVGAGLGDTGSGMFMGSGIASTGETALADSYNGMGSLGSGSGNALDSILGGSDGLSSLYSGAGDATSLFPAASTTLGTIGEGGSGFATDFGSLPQASPLTDFTMGGGTDLSASTYGAEGDSSTSWLSQLLGGAGKYKLPLGMAGLGMLTNAIEGPRQNKAVANSLEDYFNQKWTPQSRDAMMQGVMGQTNAETEAMKRKLGSGAAAAGRGGGLYGSELERTEESGRETAASALANTFAPTNFSAQAYEDLAKAQTGSNWYDSLLQGVSGASSNWPLMALMSNL